MGTTEERLHRLSEAARESARVAADDREARDRAIENADQDGMAIRAIARATDMSPGNVQRIIVDRATKRPHIEVAA